MPSETTPLRGATYDDFSLPASSRQQSTSIWKDKRLWLGLAVVLLAAVGITTYFVSHHSSPYSSTPHPSKEPKHKLYPEHLQQTSSSSSSSSSSSASPYPHYLDTETASFPTSFIEAASNIRNMMDPTVDPCSDFWKFACGGFLKRDLEGDLGRWGTGDVLVKKAQNSLKEIIDNIIVMDEQAKGNGREIDVKPEANRLASYYKSCIDLDTVEELKMTPLQDLLQAVDDANRAQLFDILAKIHLASKKTDSRRAGDGFDLLDRSSGIIYSRPFFDYNVIPDAYNPKMMILNLDPDGLALPTDDYYTDKVYASALEKYPLHVQNMFELTGFTAQQAQDAAADVVAFETDIAKIMQKSPMGLDSKEYYNRLTDVQYQKFEGILFIPYLSSLFGNMKLPDYVVVSNIKYLKQLDDLLQKTKLRTLQNYVRWHIIHTNARFLYKEVRDEDFNFFGKVILGSKEEDRPPRWRECVRMADSNLPDDLGRQFVAKYFSKDIYDEGSAMLENVELAMRMIMKEDHKDWLDKVSYAGAKEKLDKVKNMVGYTSQWDNYSDVDVNDKKYLQNSFALRSHSSRRQIAQVGKDKNPALWDMSPPTCNAYYDSTLNMMVFPAGNFLAPFYSEFQSQAYNYGALGNVMGHELSHAFDAQGRQFNADGKLDPWMSKSTSNVFDKKADCVVKLFDTYTVEHGLHVSGTRTLSENLADISGVKAALRAYHIRAAAMSKQQKAQEARQVSFVGNYTAEQVYFIGFAQSWCEIDSEGYDVKSVSIDVHSPAKYRIIGPLSQSPVFADTFKCPAGSPMNPKDKCIVW